MENLPSSRFTLQTRDFVKGLVLAVVVPILVVMQQSLDAGVFVFNWKLLGMTAISALITYLLKNFLTNDVKVAQKTIVEAEIKKEEIKAAR